MTSRPPRNPATLRAARACAAAVLVSAGGLGLSLPVERAFAQLPTEPCDFCPRPGLEVVPSSEVVRIRWSEVPPTEGRRVGAPRLVAFDDSSSTVELLGGYTLDCDYRLTIRKIAEPQNSFGKTVRMDYAIRTNTAGTGAPLDQDTVFVFEADTAYPLEERLTGNLSLRVSPNVNQPASPLGTINVTAGGVNTSNSIFTRYEVTALNTVASLSEGLMVRVRGPVTAAVPADSTFLVDTPGQKIPVMNGMNLTFSDGAVTGGTQTTWTARYLFPPSARVDVNLESFDGYHLWRSDLPDVNDFTLIGEIVQCESKFDFALITEEELTQIDVRLDYNPLERAFEVQDRDIHDDFPYRYAVSTFDRGFLGNEQSATFEGPLTKSDKFYPARQERQRGTKAFVVPNPYKRRAQWQEGSPKIVFANLPTRCTIRIFNEAADHVATLTHGPGIRRSTSPTSREWDLTSDVGQALVPGIYIYYIEGTDETESGPEAFQQTGKMIIVR